ncbi:MULTISPECIES: hypothetical protein [Ralstonia solanacearum species complex]|uniref:hypothetical protein n=1 Tax=Ralstonia solanacearum species complex TaxID=3116862 RepID=UPI00142F5D51|nr:hypothetical protein [Ralstonia solanacearum]
MMGLARLAAAVAFQWLRRTTRPVHAKKHPTMPTPPEGVPADTELEETSAKNPHARGEDRDKNARCRKEEIGPPW